MIGLFVTGTDTGCGKTAVACAIARAGRDAGLRVRVMKPIETGCAERDGERVAEDAQALAEAADDRRDVDRVCPYRLALPAAPDVAARDEAVRLDLGVIDAGLRDAARDADLLLVEGAGGLRVPILPGLDMGGLATRLGLPLLVAARAALGTINHTELTLDVARARGLPVAGVVISHVAPALSRADRLNLDRLLETLPVPRLGELGHGASRIEPAIDFAKLADPAS